MSAITQHDVEVVRVGNPIELRFKSNYKVKAVGKEQLIDSTVLVHTTTGGSEAAGAERITKVEDRWGGDVPPEGVFAKVKIRNPSMGSYAEKSCLTANVSDV